MVVPASFSRQLAAEFGGQLRCRWSAFKGRFVIERKGARGRQDELLPPKPRVPQALPLQKRRYLEQMMEERLIQARGGYYTVMEVAPGQLTPCTFCGQDVRLVPKSRRTARCAACGKEMKAFFWPLGDDLLLHLRWTDPDRGGVERVFADMVASEEARERQLARDRANTTEALIKEDFPYIFEIPSVGWTPQTGAMWQ